MINKFSKVGKLSIILLVAMRAYALDIPVNTPVLVSDQPQLIKKISSPNWAKGCHDILSDLAYIRIKYWGFDDKPHEGEIIVNKALTHDVIAIFNALYQERFPIERMQTIDEFDNDDERAMEANNTSSFNCRETTGKPGAFSLHSYGRAVDINPRVNPYIKKGKVLPKNAYNTNEHNPFLKGKITKQSEIYRLFVEKKWRWGGDWQSLKDNHHFEKK